MGGSHSDKRPYPKPGPKPKVDPEDEPDPDWIEFDPEKDKGKFFGHVMADESKLRQNVVT